MVKRWPASVLASSLTVALLLLTGSPAIAQVMPASVPALEPPAPSPAAGVLPGPSVAGLFEGIFSDVRNLPSRDALTWLSVGAAAAAIGHVADARVTTALSGSSGLHETLEAGGTIGSARIQFGGAVATYAFGRLSGNRQIATLGGDLVRAQVLAQAMTQAVKVSVRRTRPDGGAFSFPSGHTSTAFASAAVLQNHFGWTVGIPAYAAAIYVAGSRVQEKRHYLTDIAFGAALGIVAGRTVTVGRGDTRFAVTPAVVPGGGGLSFTWMGRR